MVAAVAVVASIRVPMGDALRATLIKSPSQQPGMMRALIPGGGRWTLADHIGIVPWQSSR